MLPPPLDYCCTPFLSIFAGQGPPFETTALTLRRSPMARANMFHPYRSLNVFKCSFSSTFCHGSNCTLTFTLQCVFCLIPPRLTYEHYLVLVSYSDLPFYPDYAIPPCSTKLQPYHFSVNIIAHALCKGMDGNDSPRSFRDSKTMTASRRKTRVTSPIPPTLPLISCASSLVLGRSDSAL